jgi:hypothetical protein
LKWPIRGPNVWSNVFNFSLTLCDIRPADYPAIALELIDLGTNEGSRRVIAPDVPLMHSFFRFGKLAHEAAVW